MLVIMTRSGDSADIAINPERVCWMSSNPEGDDIIIATDDGEEIFVEQNFEDAFEALKPEADGFVVEYQMSIRAMKLGQKVLEIPTREGDTAQQYHELHVVEVSRGHIVVQIRNHNKANSGETLQTESSNGGRTWSVPHSIGVWGLPSHLLRLRNGKLLMTYGYRRPPYGNQARFSDDGGKSWSEPMTISGDGAGGDLGYPSTVELADGGLLTVWYESMKGSPRAVLRQARWKMEI